MKKPAVEEALRSCCKRVFHEKDPSCPGGRWGSSFCSFSLTLLYLSLLYLGVFLHTKQLVQKEADNWVLSFLPFFFPSSHNGQLKCTRETPPILARWVWVLAKSTSVAPHAAWDSVELAGPRNCKENFGYSWGAVRSGQHISLALKVVSDQAERYGSLLHAGGQ